ncbi:MAG: NAD(P)(+) transhydrogenase (Re/Si-specific) subunit beta, partial [Bacteroidia bacterium]|nr:NAD(P)(+) transhydrogenase (Re/Si-specific) subunit beta [Bacteroidia bacterium]
MNTIQNIPIGLSVLEISYLIASVLFIFGLKMLSHPETARKGNFLAAIGMGLAIICTLLFHKKDGQPIGHIGLILAAIAIGTAIGWTIAVKVKMTAMPQLVSFFKGMGGAAAALISLMEFPRMNPELIAQSGMLNGHAIAILLGLVIGSISFAGSMIAFGKLAEKIGDPKLKFMRVVNLLFLFGILVFVVFILAQGQVSPKDITWMAYVLLGLSLIYGITFVIPIGGADMPVVISLLNSFTGVAAAMGGFLYNNQVMLTGGILV